MKIKHFFDIYIKYFKEINNIDEIFSDSGMVNNYGKLDFGFFPLGSGILTTKNSEIKNAELIKCKVLVLGNDFGTEKDFKEKCPNNRERQSNPTIRNLICGIGLDCETTFFTNLYLGLRDSGTNLKRAKVLRKEYKNICFSFLKKQLDFFNPEIVLCLGSSVGKVLSNHSLEFNNFSQKILKLYESETNDFVINSNCNVLGSRKFILIPHPSMAHFNWNDNIENKIKIQIFQQ